jgi:ribosomal protein S18 acetylase RimI-like enzyme
MAPGDRAPVAALAEADPACWVSREVFDREFAAGRFRREWTWIAKEGRRIVARAVWWGRAGDELPLALDCVWVDPSADDPARLARLVVVAGLRALEAAGLSRPPSYELRLPGAWREQADLRAGVEWRRQIAGEVGLCDELERLQWRWDAGTALWASSGRLWFAAEADDSAFLEVFQRVAVASLDVTTQRAVRTLGAEAAARDELQFYRSTPGDRGWWRLARTSENAVVGFVIPSATYSGPNVGYLGVVPEARGRGYVDDLLAEATRLHAERGAAQISATTDVTNVPMAAAFARHGYVLSEHRLVFSAPPD